LPGAGAFAETSLSVARPAGFGSNGAAEHSLSPFRGSSNLTTHYPRLAEPHLGLNSDRCSAAG
jgi:hypothetical protein